MPGGRMRLSKKTEYALRALIYAARHPEGTTFQIKELAVRNGIPKKFLELILLELKNAGIVVSRRGVGGGYLLALRPEAIRSSEILEAAEGPIARAFGPISVPIYATAIYRYEAFGKHRGFDYSRSENPTRQAAEKAIADLEGGQKAVALSSGSAALSAA